MTQIGCICGVENDTIDGILIVLTWYDFPLGVHVSKYITSHGLALNCNTDLSWFDHIVPCGIQGKSVTSLSKELNTDIKIEDVVPILLKKFQNLFNCQLIMSE